MSNLFGTVPDLVGLTSLNNHGILLTLFTVFVGVILRKLLMFRAECLSTGVARRLKFPPEQGLHPGPTQDWVESNSLQYRSGFVEVDSHQIWWQSFRPISGPIRGIVVMYHGYGDHSDYLIYEIAHDLAVSGGLIVIAFDQPGFGRSDGLWGYVPDWFEHVSSCMKATEAIVPLVSSPGGPKLPIFGYGQSMGGGIAITAGILHPTLFAGILLTAPMCGIAAGLRRNVLVERFFIFLSGLFPTLPIAPVADLGALCYEDASFYEYVTKTNMLNYPGQLRLGTARALMGAQEWIGANAKRLETPFLVLHGDTDYVTSAECSQALFRAAGTKDKEIEILKGYYHVMLGPGAGKGKSNYAMQRLVAWIKHRC